MLISNLVSTFLALKNAAALCPAFQEARTAGSQPVWSLKVVFKDLNFKDEGMKIILGPHRAPFIAQVLITK